MCQMCDLSFVGFAEPQNAMLDSFVDALKRGWSPHSEVDVSRQLLDEIKTDANGYLVKVSDKRPAGGTRTLDDGRVVPLLPQRIRWIWDGDFCGQINLRWQPGTSELPEYVLGHVGYAVVPWKRGHGLARKALRHMLAEARDVGLLHIDACTTTDNIASQRVIESNGGILQEQFHSHMFDATVERLRYRIEL
jgi:predicted acetyltransferase